ncbi:MAG: FMN-dependent NADH-azoreductase [Gaiellaceae bacterium]|jgi:FMN-dependent NADH-azoreductase|nr:FMN-dependent NADH-azoreductase [Gaiellaceae bacterium]
MPTLLHLDSSLRHEGSRSRALSAHFTAAWRQANPDGTVVYRDLASDPIPHLDLAAFSANLLAEEDRTPEQREARKLAETLANELLAADEIVLGIPLYNFGPPSTFKAWFDRIVVLGLTVDMETGGLLGGRRLTVTAARGGGYGPGTPREGWDHREPWLHHAFSSVGIDDIRVVHAELTLARESPRMSGLEDLEDQSIADAYAAIDELFAARRDIAA